MTTINPSAEMPVFEATQPATITDKKPSAIAAGLSKVGSAALTAIKAVGIAFAILATGGLILANKDFRQMASEFFFGPKVEVDYHVDESNKDAEAINSYIDAQAEAKKAGNLHKLSAKKMQKVKAKLQHVEQEKREIPELTNVEKAALKACQAADHVADHKVGYGLGAAAAAAAVVGGLFLANR